MVTIDTCCTLNYFCSKEDPEKCPAVVLNINIKGHIKGDSKGNFKGYFNQDLNLIKVFI